MRNKSVTLNGGLEKVPGQELERNVSVMRQVEEVQGVDHLAHTRNQQLRI